VLLGKHLAEKEQLEEQTRAEVVSPLVSSSEAHGSLGSGTCVYLLSLHIYILISVFFILLLILFSYCL